MLWLKAFHIVSLVAWFAALFYLPRLYVYHASASDHISINRFKIMERRLYYGIMWPAAIFTTFFGLTMLGVGWSYYKTAAWMHLKLFFVILLWVYHLYCGYLRAQFMKNNNQHTERFYRILNEIPTLFLVVVVILVVVKPF
jgi:protoporphyrinogen IX oxidase